MNRELTGREKVLLLVLTVLVIALGYFKLLYEPVQDQTQRYREDAAQEQLELEQNLVKAAQMEKMEQALEKIHADGTSRAIPTFNNRESILRDLRGILAGTREYHVDFGDGVRQEGYIVLHTAQLSYQTGSYAQSRAVVDALSASDNINRISDLRIELNDRSGMDPYYETTLTITYFEVAS